MLSYTEPHDTEKSEDSCKIISLKREPKGKPRIWMTVNIRALEIHRACYFLFLKYDKHHFITPIVYRVLCKMWGWIQELKKINFKVTFHGVREMVTMQHLIGQACDFRGGRGGHSMKINSC